MIHGEPIQHFLSTCSTNPIGEHRKKKDILKNLSIGEKLTVGFGVTGLLLVAVVWIYHHALVEVMDTYQSLQTTQAAKKYHLLNIHRYMLEARRSEKDFLAQRDTQYIDRVQQHVEMIKAEAQQLMQVETRTDGDPIAAEINRLITVYQDAFTKITEAWIINGLDHNSGLQGRFRDTIHAVEARARNFETGRLYLTLLQIRRAEKDLGLRKVPIYQIRVQELIDRFQAQLETSNLGDDLKKTLSDILALYQTEFEIYADAVLNNEDIHGGKGPFRDAAHTLESVLAERYVPDLEKDILSLRRHEKDYLLRGDTAYVELERQKIAQILKNIAGSRLPDADKTLLTDSLHRYEDDFLALVEHNNEIVELAVRMGDAAHQIEPFLSAGVDEAVASMGAATGLAEASARNEAAFAMAIALLSILVSATFAFYFSRGITRPVNTLIQLAKLFAPDEQKPPPEKAERDEVVILTQTMGRMTGNLHSTMDEISDHADELEQIANEMEKIDSKDEAMSALRATITTLKQMATDLKNRMEKFA